jgi:hypothetical protein
MKHRINFFDTNTGNSDFSNLHWPVPDDVEYIKPPLLEYDGITVFTDEQCFSPIVDQVKSKWKIAWAFESPAIKPHVYQHIDQISYKFDQIFVCNPSMGNGNSKYKQSYFGACWIPESHCQIYPKSKLLSIVASNKNYAQGHQLRHEVIRNKMHPALDLWGSGYNKFGDEPSERIKPFAPYQYVIVIENCQYPGYFTDKIVDCFAAGCIPIYWGNPKIKELFDSRGFYTWTTIRELGLILDHISNEDYESKRPYIEENFKRFPEFASPDRWMARNCYDLLK